LALDLPDPSRATLQALLSPDEVERASRFIFERDRRRYVAARGQLRQLLGGYIGVAPEALSFAYGQYGKPRLADPSASVEFNLAHSAALAVVAVAHGAIVGVDVEHRPERKPTSRPTAPD
jgi:4'-phosphopantetheinyl transferase